MIFRLNIFWKDLFLFGVTLLLGIFSAHNYKPVLEAMAGDRSFSWPDFVIFLAFFMGLSLVLLKFKKLGAISLRFFLVLVVFSGSQIIFGSLFNSPVDILAAIILTAIFIIVKNVAVHDLGMMIGIAGAGSLLGINLSPPTAVILLVILSFYDILAVYWTKHMVYLAKGMIESGAIFGFIIPFDIKDIFYSSSEAKAKMGEKFMILGSGDIGLPIVLAGSVAVTSVRDGLIVGLFSLAGLFLTHLIFINQKERKPMAALPPIATLTIVGYLVTQLL